MGHRDLCIAILLAVAIHVLALGPLGVYVAPARARFRTGQHSPDRHHVEFQARPEAPDPVAPPPMPPELPTSSDPPPTEMPTEPMDKPAEQSPVVDRPEPTPAAVRPSQPTRPPRKEDPTVDTFPLAPTPSTPPTPPSEPKGQPATPQRTVPEVKTVPSPKSTAPPSESIKSPGVETPISSSSPIIPKYPRVSRRRDEEGTVHIRVTVSPTGRLELSEVVRSSGHVRLDAAALEAVRQARFQPARKNGQSIDHTDVVRIKFQLR